MAKLNTKTRETFFESLTMLEMIFHNMLMKNLDADKSESCVSLDEWCAELRVRFNPDMTEDHGKKLLMGTMELYSKKTVTIFPHNDS